MPSPIAHSSLLLAIAPPIRPALQALPRGRRWWFFVAVVFALLAPDADIALGLIFQRGPFALHGGPTHSLVLAPLFGLFWAGVLWGCLFREEAARRAMDWRWLWVLGTAAFASHVFMDWLTPGRGVGMFWPINEHRVGSPIKLFVGVEHSNWRDWHHHGLTVMTETGFALLMAAAGWALSRCRRSKTGVAHPLPPEPAA